MGSETKVNEQYWMLVGERRGEFWQCEMVGAQEGRPTEVGFPYEDVFNRQDEKADVIGFLHTHPSGQLSPSQKDIETMQAWTSCLGRPLLCLIAHDVNVEAFWFADDQCIGCRLPAEFRNDSEVVIRIRC